MFHNLADKASRSLLLHGLTALLALGSLGASAAQAGAGSGMFTARLATALSEPRRELVGEQLWRCSADGCTTRFDGAHSVRTCAKVAQAFGPVVRFSTPRGELSAEQLARCNGAD